MTYWLSPSSLSVFTECPQCFWYEKKQGVKIEKPRGIFPGLPGGYDRVTKDYFDGFREKGTMPPEKPFQELASQWYRFFSDARKLAQWRNAKTGGIDYHDKKGNKFFGALDDLLINTKTKKAVVFDVKTKGDEPPADAMKYNLDQMSAYAFLLQQNGFEVEDSAILAFYWPIKIDPDIERMVHGIRLDRAPVNPQSALDRFNAALSILDENEPPEASATCGWCNWLERRLAAKKK